MKPTRVETFKRQGHCKQCGFCCSAKNISSGAWKDQDIAPGRFATNVPTLVRHLRELGFTVKSVTVIHKVYGTLYNFSVHCNNFRNGRCTRRKDRPYLCRYYPTSPEECVQNKDCGYEFVKTIRVVR